jgi:hypothetical protein
LANGRKTEYTTAKKKRKKKRKKKEAQWPKEKVQQDKQRSTKQYT